jgi:molybdopterin-guanine dinucleotide biosynthesis protein A
VSAPLLGLVLAGGRSTRMGSDKAAIRYGEQAQLDRAVELLREVTAETLVSVRSDQSSDPLRSKYAQVIDSGDIEGPAAGIRAAQLARPDAAWLVVACDLPNLTGATIRHLIAHRDPAKVATAYRSSHDGLPEPLCAIYEPAAGAALQAFLATGRNCPRKFLINSDTLLLSQPEPESLDNVNTPDELAAARRRAISGSTTREIRVQYYALLREQAGRRDETVATAAGTPRELFRELSSRHHFTLEPKMLKVAVNAEFRDWSHPLANGDMVVFIPPVAGG